MKWYFLLLIIFSALSLIAQRDTSITVDEIANMSIEEMLKVPISGVSIYEQNQKTVPGNVFVINSEDIISRGYYDLSDVLKDAMGFDITDNARGFGEYYRVRGIEGNDRFLVLIDGHKINPPSGTFLSIGNSISIRYAERIEIIYGPVSVIYGSEALSGVINIVTKKKFEKKGMHGYANLSYGSQNSFDEEIDLNFSNKKGICFGLHARFYQSDGLDLLKRDTVYNLINNYIHPQIDDFQQPIKDHTILAHFTYKNLKAWYFRQGFNEGNALGTHPKGNIFNKEYKWQTQNQHLILSYDKKLNSSELLINLCLTQFKIDPETQFYKWKNSYSTDTSFSQFMTGDDKAIKFLASYNKIFNKQLIFLAGVESEYISSIPPYANDQIFGKSVKFEGDNAEIVKNNLTKYEFRAAGFAQISYNPFEKLTAVVGLRYSYSDLNENVFTPRMGLIFNPQSDFIIKYFYGSGFQAPSMFYKYEQWGAFSVVMLSEQEVKLIDPNWALKSQKVATHDLSFTWKIGEKLLISSSSFSYFLTDLIERATFSNSVYNKYYSTDENQVYSIGIRNENIGSQFTYGTNLKINYNLNYSITTYFSYSYLDGYSKVGEDESEITGIANHKIWTGLNFKNFYKNISLSIRYKWVGEMNNENQIFFPDGKQPGYSNLDIYIDYRYLFDRFNFYIDFKNILNQDYQHAGLYQQSGGYLPTIHQNLRMIKVGIEVLF